MIRIDELEKDELLEIIDLYEAYKIGKSYEVGDAFQYENMLYEVIQGHKSQADWPPNEMPALYLSSTPDGVIPEWVQPTGSHDAYNTGDKVIFEGGIYESIIDGNVWSPTDHPEGWRVIDNET